MVADGLAQPCPVTGGTIPGQTFLVLGKLAGETLVLATVAVSDADYFRTMRMQPVAGTGPPWIDSAKKQTVGRSPMREHSVLFDR